MPMLVILDMVLLAAVTVYISIALSHVAMMWVLRGNFIMALRSPRLACAIGIYMGLNTLCAIYIYIISYGSITMQAYIAVGLPATFFLLCWGVIVRVIRLLVMYDPRKRRRWGRYLKEKGILRGILGVILLAEVAVFSAFTLHGIPRVSSVVGNVASPLALLTLLLAALRLTRELKATHDLANISREMLHVGSCMVVGSVLYAGLKLVPMPTAVLRYYRTLWVSCIHFPPLWIMFIAPVRQFLREKNKGVRRVRLWPFVPWEKMTNIRVYAVPEVASKRSIHVDNDLEELRIIIDFLPLREAFQEFCRKALCSESIQFLVDVSSFKHAVQAADIDDFHAFVSIVDEYIKDDSPSEINIDSCAKRNVPMHLSPREYVKLDKDKRAGFFALAEKEISQMLSENLVNRFRASEQYSQIAEQLLDGHD